MSNLIQHGWWVGSALLLLAASAVLFQAMSPKKTPKRVSRRFAETLRVHGIKVIEPIASGGKSNSWLMQRVYHLSATEREEMALHLRQAGMNSPIKMQYFLLAAWLLPLLLALMMGGYGLIHDDSLSDMSMSMAFVFTFSFIAIRRGLKWRAEWRRKAIRREVITWVHLLRMLFEAGLSFENALLIINQQGQHLIPHLANELGQVLKRIQNGQDISDALREMANVLNVAELSDTVSMLKQVATYGGNIRDSLSEYAQLIEDRQLSDLREYVSKLSGKMTIVMALFMFPALLIFIAGPGFINLAQALGGLGK